MSFFFLCKIWIWWEIILWCAYINFKSNPNHLWFNKQTSHKSSKVFWKIKVVTHLAVMPKSIIGRSSEKNLKNPAMAMVRNLAAAISLMKEKLEYCKLNDLYCFVFHWNPFSFPEPLLPLFSGNLELLNHSLPCFSHYKKVGNYNKHLTES